MRNKATYTLYPRTLASGLKVFYYQCYNKNGERQWGKSTGLTKRTEANEYCLQLLRKGLLIPEQKKPTFAEFSNGWWNIETCKYLKWRELHEPITNSTLIIYQANFKNHIKDYFANYKLDEITPLVIENWLMFMKDKGINRGEGKRKKKKKVDENGIEINEVKQKKLLKAKTINLALFTLKTMLGEAVRLKLINSNPCDDVKDLKEEETVREILTPEEFKKLFPVDWSSVWEKEMAYKANLLAACAGLRIGELLGLRGNDIFDNYINVHAQYLKNKYVDHTKTKDDRCIPISETMRKTLDDLLSKNGNGYVFSDDGGKTPTTNNWLNKWLNKALEKIGISYEEKLKRNLSFHAWRHFLNTFLLNSNVSIKKVQKVTGHKSLKMTELYTHFDTKQFTEVVAVQDKLLTFNTPETKLIKVIKPKKKK